MSIENILLIDFSQDRNVNLTRNVFLDNAGQFVLVWTKEGNAQLMKIAFQEPTANLELVKT